MKGQRMHEQLPRVQDPQHEPPPVLEYEGARPVPMVPAAWSVMWGWLAVVSVLPTCGMAYIWGAAWAAYLWAVTPTLAVLAIVTGFVEQRRLSAVDVRAARRAEHGRILGWTSVLLMPLMPLVFVAIRVCDTYLHPRPPVGVTRCLTDISRIKGMLGAFQADCGRYPTTAEGFGIMQNDPGIAGWKGPYFEKLPTDPWKRSYIYVYPGTHNRQGFDIYSAGPDGKPGTADDIGNWQER
jgi:general secretion pathway protein G